MFSPQLLVSASIQPDISTNSEKWCVKVILIQSKCHVYGMDHTNWIRAIKGSVKEYSHKHWPRNPHFPWFPTIYIYFKYRLFAFFLSRLLCMKVFQFPLFYLFLSIFFFSPIQVGLNFRAIASVFNCQHLAVVRLVGYTNCHDNQQITYKQVVTE